MLTPHKFLGSSSSCYFWLRLVIQALSSYLVMMHASLAYHSKLILIFYGSSCPLMFLLHPIAGELIDPASQTPDPHRQLPRTPTPLFLILGSPFQQPAKSSFTCKALATTYSFSVASTFFLPMALIFWSCCSKVFLILGNLIVQLLGPFHQSCLAHRFPKAKVIKKHKGRNQVLNGFLWIDNGWEGFLGYCISWAPQTKKIPPD